MGSHAANGLDGPHAGTLMPKTLTLNVVVIEDTAEAMRRSLRSIKGGRSAAPGSESRDIGPEEARRLLAFPVVRIIRALKHERPQTLAALAEAVGRDAASVRVDLQILEQCGVVALRDAGKKGGPLLPRLVYDEVVIRIK
jgi:predicted transcriptional regulator